MKILLTNDDGILAPGLVALYDAFSKIHDVWVVAPADQRSACGHSITVHHHLSLQKIRRKGAFYGYAVKGTPADCVKLALCELMNEKPDLVISGINPGPNTGVSVFYSGTISAAREAVISGVPAMALSLSRKEVSDFRFAARFATQLARLVVSKSLMAPFTMLNVNIPAIGQQHIQGIRITSQAHSRFVEEFELTRKKGAKTQYMLKGEMVLIESTGSSDEEALKENYISITPLKLDLTDQASFLKMKDLARKIKI